MIFHLIMLQLLLNLVGFTTGQPSFIASICIQNGNNTTNSSYKGSLDRLLSSLSPNIQSNGFYNASDGPVYATALCRGDVRLDICRACVTNATKTLIQECPTSNSAIGWYDLCMLRYSNISIVGTLNTKDIVKKNESGKISDVDVFNKELRALLDELRARAKNEAPLRKFATGEAVLTGFRTLYALVQCTPDLSVNQCNKCLVKETEHIPNFANGKKGGRVLGPSCNFRYDVNNPFFQQSIPLYEPPPTPTGGDDHSKIIVAIVIPVTAFIIIGFGVFLVKRKDRKKKSIEQVEAMEDMRTVESLQYDFNTVKIATGGFDSSNTIGQGGFGVVYKGCLSNGQEIAVKRLAKDSGQGDLEFKNEVLLMARLQHRNLVRLLGFGLEGKERLLIYEYMANASLDQIIFDKVKRSLLDWDKRYKIIIGVARGLLYLHVDSTLRIIHRDLKASNVLLDEGMHPKIADFGMARLFVAGETQANTTNIVGTYGYMAPEYLLDGLFSRKSDVFSYGVLVLEIVSGQRNNLFKNGYHLGDLLSHVWKNWRDGTTSSIIDPKIMTNSASIHEVERCIHIGLLCVQEDDAVRPTMESVLLMFKSLSLTLPVPSEPALYMRNEVESELSLLSESDSGVLKSNLLP